MLKDGMHQPWWVISARDMLKDGMHQPWWFISARDIKINIIWMEDVKICVL